MLCTLRASLGTFHAFVEVVFLFEDGSLTFLRGICTRGEARESLRVPTSRLESYNLSPTLWVTRGPASRVPR